MRFKIGDKVVISRIIEPAQSSVIHRRWAKQLGKIATVVDIHDAGTRYRITTEDGSYTASWLSEELELAKNHIVKQILNDL